MKIEYDNLANQYERNRRINEAVLKELLATSRIDGSSRVLDVGCGTGNYILAIAERVGCQCWGIEPSDNMLAAARRRGPGQVTLLKGSAEEMMFPDSFFDFIFSVDVIHHVADRKAHFVRAHAQLVNGGLLCIVTDSAEIIRTREPLSRYFPETVEAEFRRYPPVQQLKEELRQSGFTRVTETTTELPYLVTDLQAYAERAFSSLHLISDDAFDRGLARMKEALASGPVQGISRYMHVWAGK
jgi:SAM-dependent methyltransferase